jgi:tRNA 2-selenouridine synthase
MGQSPVVWLEEALEGRVERILKDYVVDSAAEFIAVHGPQAGIEAYATRLRRSLDAIVKRLGGERHSRLAEIMDAALAEQKRTGAVDRHRDWIEALLREYYDPMYAYQKQKKAERIVFAGDRGAVLEYLQQQRDVAGN